MLPKWFREYLTFHRSERRGVMFLSILLIILICFNLYQRFFWKPDFERITLEYGPQIVAFSNRQDSVRANGYEAKKPWLPKQIDYFKFDPNTLDSAGWVGLGFSPKQAAAVIRYRNAGAVFRKPEDVKKLFVVDDQKYAELAPFIAIKQLPEPPKTKKEFKVLEKESETKFGYVMVELNSADTAQLQQLYGIGSSFAKRIVKYRELLGGYISKEQLLEVYGMDSARYLPIEQNIMVDTTVRNRININTADFKTLLQHPYLNKNQVRAIINYRKQHGDFQSIEGLQEIHLLKGEPYRKIAPYFTVQ